MPPTVLAPTGTPQEETPTVVPTETSTPAITNTATSIPTERATDTLTHSPTVTATSIAYLPYVHSNGRYDFDDVASSFQTASWPKQQPQRRKRRI